MDSTRASGDVHAFRLEQMMRRYGTAVLRMCCLYLRDRTMAEEAAQDTFVKAYKGMESLRGDTEQSEKAWLMRIAINTCKDYHRSAWFRNRDKRALPEDLRDDAQDREMENRLLADTVSRLPVKLKEVVLLHYYQELSYDEMAMALHTSRSTIYERLKKAKEVLRNALEGWGE